MSAYTNHGKATSTKRNSERKSSLTERDRDKLRRIHSKNHRTTAAQVTEKLHTHLEDPVFTKTAQSEFTNPSSTVQLQLLNFRLLEVMLRCVIDGALTIKPGHQTTGNDRLM
jgi:hypothetical protein